MYKINIFKGIVERAIGKAFKIVVMLGLVPNTEQTIEPDPEA